MATRRRRGVDAGAFSSPACYLHEFQHAPVSTPAHGIAIKRVYEAPERADGYRVLIDRLWPRGIGRKRAALDAWLTDLAPSTALRAWFHRDPKRWPQFARRYRAELRAQAPLLQTLRQRARRERVTLLYAARNERVNHAVLLRATLRRASHPALLSATVRGARSTSQLKVTRSGKMPRIVKLLVALSLAAALTGCVVAPLGPPRPYVATAVAVPAPLVVFHGGYYWRH